MDPSTSNPWRTPRERVAASALFLTNPLPPGPEVCFTCRVCESSLYGEGLRHHTLPDGIGVRQCRNCCAHLEKSDGVVADLVAPISYAIRDGQHAHDLLAYQSPVAPSIPARQRIAALAITYLLDHAACLSRTGFTHLATLPGAAGQPHRLAQLLQQHIRLPRIMTTANPACTTISSQFAHDRFTVTSDCTAARVLLLDDTWFHGAQTQSLAHALKIAGAARVVAVPLGRYLPESPIRPVMPQLDSTRCTVDDLAAQVLPLIARSLRMTAARFAPGSREREPPDSTCPGTTL